MNAPAPAPIVLHRLHELWVHTGTACNLACPFCHEGSKPGDARIGAPKLSQLAPRLDEASALGVERFAFTGGEPLILKGILDILLHALNLRPALVLTKGTAPFIRRTHQLAQLRQAPHPLSFRVSLDHADEARHDAARGLKNFRKALEGLKLLHAAGFEVGITRQAASDEDAAAIDARFRQLLRRQGLPQDLPIVALPDLAAFGETAKLPSGGAPTEESKVMPACARSRMALLRGGTLRLQACPLTDDVEGFDTGDSLHQALQARVVTDHPRCAVCRSRGVDYIGAAAQKDMLAPR